MTNPVRSRSGVVFITRVLLFSPNPPDASTSRLHPTDFLAVIGPRAMLAPEVFVV
jgi:hypothetical protein